MSDDFKIWTEPKSHSLEGHIFNGTLYFNDNIIWGPHNCHDNTTDLINALSDADPRFRMRFERKSNSREGHTRSISIRSNGRIVLDKLSTHDNMDGFVIAVNTARAVAGPP
ncbi:hypothetical protein ACHAPT_006463 [Fusarium lateritium]